MRRCCLAMSSAMARTCLFKLRQQPRHHAVALSRSGVSVFLLRRRPQLAPCEVTHSPKQLSTSSHEAGDEYSSEASEIDTQSTVPTWLRQELDANFIEGDVMQDNDDDGNEADNTSDVSDDDGHHHTIFDSSMSSIHINKVLTPANKSGLGTNFTTKKAMQSLPLAMSPQVSRNHPSSMNSLESNTHKASREHMSDSSSSETAIVKKKDTRSSQAQNQNSAPVHSGVKMKGSVTKPVPRARSAGRGQNKSHEEVLKETLAARGFVSDVTVKRREEALLYELELMREEKRKAERQLQMLQQEREAQAEKFRQEAEKIAEAREQQLLQELEHLRRELELQTSQLADRQRLVGQLQQQLQGFKSSASIPQLQQTIQLHSQQQDGPKIQYPALSSHPPTPQRDILGSHVSSVLPNSASHQKRQQSGSASRVCSLQ